MKVDNGILVNEYLETSVPGIFAAGDVARWPDPLSGQQIRVEHWVVAERQGQVAARNILGYREPFDSIPYFWTRQFDVSLKYVGPAERWDAVEIEGSLDAEDCAVKYKQARKSLTLKRRFEHLVPRSGSQGPGVRGSFWRCAFVSIVC